MANHSEAVTISIADAFERQKINAYDLGAFLYYFRSAYVAAFAVIEKERYGARDVARLGKEVLSEAIRREVLSHTTVPSLWSTALPEELDLEFDRISKDSPLKLIARATSASMVALTLAVIVSGGSADLSEGKFEVPPLAQTIRELKGAFDEEQPRELPSEKRQLQNEDEDNDPPLSPT